MTGHGEHRSVWERLDHNTCGHRFDERTRWRVGTFAQSLVNGPQSGPSPVADAAEEFLRAECARQKRRWHALEQGWVQGWPGE